MDNRIVSASVMRARHGVHMYEWDLDKFNKLEEYHAIYWKRSNRLKKNRPLCGALCRDGHACKAKVVVNSKDKPINGRCRMHGGLSTGAKTEEGKQKCKEAARRGMIEYWKKRRALQNQNNIREAYEEFS